MMVAFAVWWVLCAVSGLFVFPDPPLGWTMRRHAIMFLFFWSWAAIVAVILLLELMFGQDEDQE